MVDMTGNVYTQRDLKDAMNPETTRTRPPSLGRHGNSVLVTGDGRIGA